MPLMLLVLVGCAVTPDPAVPWTPEAAPPAPPPGIALTLSVTPPVEGDVLEVVVGRADPGESVSVAVSASGLGEGPCPAPLGGLCVDLAPPVARLTGTADADGRVALSAPLPPFLTVGRTIALQAFAPRGDDSVDSAPVVVAVEPAECGAAEPFPADHALHTITRSMRDTKWVASIDLDHDGFDDVVSCPNHLNVDLEWLRNRADGTFATVEHLTGLFDCNFLAVADLDGDGADALLVFGSVDDFQVWDDPSTVSVYPRVPAGDITSVATGDIDGDGLPDLLLARHYAVTWCSSATGFDVCTDIADHRYAPIGLVDDDDDGDLDVAILADGELWIAENDGGVIGEPSARVAAPGGPHALVVTDLDGDGHDDIAYSDDHLHALYWTGPSAWDEVRLVDTGSHDLLVADVDGDGDDDLAGLALFVQDVVWYENDGGTYTLHALDLDGGAAWNLTAGDADGDGAADLFGGFDVPTWFPDSPEGPAAPVRLATGNLDKLKVVDMDRDGWPDVVSTSAEDRTLRVTWNDRGTLGVPEPFFEGVYAVALEVADLDANGWPDVVIPADGGRGTQVFWQDADGFSEPEVLADGSDGLAFYPHEPRAMDIDGDGDEDLIIAGSQVWLNEAGTLTPTGDITQAIAHGVVVDLDGDGWLDLVGSREDPADWYGYDVDFTPVWRRNLGGTLAAAEAIAPSSDGRSSIATGDLDCDGDPDVVLSEYGRGVTVVENLGAGLFAAPVLVDTAGVDGHAYVVDIDGDGVDDIVHAEEDVGWLWYRGVGDLTFEAPMAMDVPDPSYNAAFGDIDADGDVDAFAAASWYSGSWVGWWENPLR